jgi:hypothetical protein
MLEKARVASPRAPLYSDCGIWQGKSPGKSLARRILPVPPRAPAPARSAGCPSPEGAADNSPGQGPPRASGTGRRPGYGPPEDTPPSHALGAHGRGEGGWVRWYAQDAPPLASPTTKSPPFPGIIFRRQISSKSQSPAPSSSKNPGAFPCNQTPSPPRTL